MLAEGSNNFTECSSGVQLLTHVRTSKQVDDDFLRKRVGKPRCTSHGGESRLAPGRGSKSRQPARAEDGEEEEKPCGREPRGREPTPEAG